MVDGTPDLKVGDTVYLKHPDYIGIPFVIQSETETEYVLKVGILPEGIWFPEWQELILEKDTVKKA